MLSQSLLGRFCLVLCFSLAACQPKIGDECITHQDCSQQNDRICDTTQPEGYCTIADCDPYNCPEEESVCVSFNNTQSSVGACNSTGRTSPYRRTFCMQSCEEDADCRSGTDPTSGEDYSYVCLDLKKKNEWSATLIQLPRIREERKNGINTKVCMLAAVRGEIEESRSDQVCTGWPEDTALGGASGGQ